VYNCATNNHGSIFWIVEEMQDSFKFDARHVCVLLLQHSKVFEGIVILRLFGALAKKPYASMATRSDGTTTTNALAITLAL
jgi:hypothetical protein